MSRAAGRDGAEGRHQAAYGLPQRPAAGTAQARTHLEYRGAHRAPGRDGPGWVTDVGLLRRVRDALASGRQP
jgi:hypothetical protein